MLWTVVVFLGPVGLGLGLGFCSKKDIVRKVLVPLGFNPIHSVPTAWDFKFSDSPPVWVLVTLKDGHTVGGLWGSRSFASSESDERDIYIQEVYKILKTKTWKKVERNDGILICGDEIKHIEFWSDE